MSTLTDRETIEAFIAAYASRDPARFAPFLDDDVTWTISGPVDLLHFCGTRRGKAAVIDLIGREVPAVLHIRQFVRDMVLIDGERAATLSRLSAVQRVENRSISYRVAQFMRFRAGKLIEFCSVIDSFDAVEQVLGHPIDVHEGNTIVADDELVAV